MVQSKTCETMKALLFLVAMVLLVSPVLAVTVTMTPTNNQVICPGSSVSFGCTASGAQGVVTYSWTFQNGFPVSSTIQNPGPVTFGTNAAGLANPCQVTVTDTDTNACSTASNSTASASINVAVIKVEFSLNPVDNIIKGATAVPVTATVTPAALASNISFQANNGNVTVQGTAPNITVTGVAVGTSTVKAILNGVEVGSFDASVIENPDFLPASGGVASGAAPSQPLNGAWGLTWEENVAAVITAGRDGGTWRAIITSATGNYSIQAVLIAGCTEVTGPGGNTTSNNWVTQVANLNCLNGPTWYMVGAVQAHEQVHANHFDDGFQTVAVVDTLEANIENLTANAANQAAAIAALSALPAFTTALTTARTSWVAEDDTLLVGDHATGGPCETAEHGVVDPMINTINAYAAAQGW